MNEDNTMNQKKFCTLGAFLRYYYDNFQKQIVLVYRGTTEENWAKRCLYLDDKYSDKVPYNHRSILNNELIIEYDSNDPKVNEQLSNKVKVKLKADNINFAVYSSGNRSQHIHILLKTYNVSNTKLFKTTLMRHYGTFYLDDKNSIYEDDDAEHTRKKIIPDLRLSCDGHLIRAEFGIHEKTQEKKTLIYASPSFPEISKVPIEVFEKYQKAQEASVYQRVSQQTVDMAEHELVKQLLDAVSFRENMDDGRERTMFALIHILKPKYPKKDELADFLWEWYCYASTQAPKMSARDVLKKVSMAYAEGATQYKIGEKYIKDLIEELGGKIEPKKQEGL